MTLKYHQGSNFIPSVNQVVKKLNDSGRKDEMQNILNFKDDSIYGLYSKDETDILTGKEKETGLVLMLCS